jgi:hypothetical protein
LECWLCFRNKSCLTAFREQIINIRFTH